MNCRSQGLDGGAPQTILCWHMAATPLYLRTTDLIKRLKIPGSTAQARKRKFYELCSTLGLRELGRREGRGEWLFPVKQVEQRYHDYLLRELR